MFALCVASGGLNMDSEFLNKYKTAKWEKVNGWELSTRYEIDYVNQCIKLDIFALISLTQLHL